MKQNSKIASFFNALFVNFRHLSFIEKIERVIERMNPTEKIVFILAGIVMIVTGLSLLVRVSDTFLVAVPGEGGSMSEGLIGSPRFINPVISISDTDKDLSGLIYSGLLKHSKDGTLIPDLASSYEITDNGLVYHFKIRTDAYFHDGKDVTADDVIFTIEKIVDPIIKSPKRTLWEGVQIEKINNKELKFKLSKPYAPFINTLTLGILPKHLWQDVTSEEFPFSQFNLSPIGSGPFQIEKVTRNGSGIPSSITLSSFNKYTLGKPLIKSLVFKFFQNENLLIKAYEANEIESMVTSPKVATEINLDKNTVQSSSLPRVFGVFLNQNLAPVFLNKEVREALDLSTPKQRIVDEVLFGFGKALHGPNASLTLEDASKFGDIEGARNLLLEADWKENAEGVLEKKTKSGNVLFSFSISTSDSPELKQTALILKEVWEKVGAKVDVKVFEAGDLSQNIIKPRKYDALLFGEVVENDTDLYPFWHSSGRNDPGLNISLYANITVDKMLEDLQKSSDPVEIKEKKEVVISEIKKDLPAIFLFSPELIYVQKGKINNISLKQIGTPSERFIDINKWFIETDKVWKFFVKN